MEKRGTNTKRTLLVAGAIILLCMCLIVGGTFALFTDTQTVKNHLKAGDLQITLKRTELTKTTLNESGFLVTLPTDTEVKDFTNPTDENVFDIKNDNGEITELIVPGSKFVAKMQLENNSDVAFGYWIEIVCTDKATGENLARQLKVSVKTDKEETAYVGNGLTVGGPDAFVGVLGIDSESNTQTFTVTVEFEDLGYTFENGVLSSTNDLAEAEDLHFDLIVYAVQETKMP